MSLNKLFATAVLGCALAFAGCGDSDEERVPKNTDDTDTSTDSTGTGNNDANTGNDGAGTGTGGTGGTTDQATTWCTDICNHQNTCTAALGDTCQSDLAACVQGCVAEGVTAESYSLMTGLTCDQINQQICSNAANHQYCSCDGIENPCPEGQACFPVGSGAGVCANSDQSFPSDAPTCDNNTPCAEGSSCIAAETGATTGICLQNC